MRWAHRRQEVTSKGATAGAARPRREGKAQQAVTVVACDPKFPQPDIHCLVAIAGELRHTLETVLSKCLRIQRE